MTQPFVLLSTQRSGSTWVIDMLNSHPAVRAYGELLLENGKGKRYGGAMDLEFFDEHLQAKRRAGADISASDALFKYLDMLYQPISGQQAAGFKLMYGQFGAYPELRAYLKDSHVAIIHLIRSNLLDVLLSKESAVQRNLFHHKGDNDLEQLRFRLDANQVAKRLTESRREINRAKTTFGAFGLPYMEVRYEELTADPSKFADVLNFLGVRPPDSVLQSALRKINVAPHSELIANYNEVAAVLAETEFSEFLR